MSDPKVFHTFQQGIQHDETKGLIYQKAEEKLTKQVLVFKVFL